EHTVRGCDVQTPTDLRTRVHPINAQDLAHGGQAPTTHVHREGRRVGGLPERGTHHIGATALATDQIRLVDEVVNRTAHREACYLALFRQHAFGGNGV